MGHQNIVNTRLSLYRRVFSNVDRNDDVLAAATRHGAHVTRRIATAVLAATAVSVGEGTEGQACWQDIGERNVVNRMRC